MSEQNREIHWAGVTDIDEKRKLLVLREDDKPFFLVPGGKVEPGETDKQAAIREVREELGAEATDLELLTDIHEVSKNTGQPIRFRVFKGRISPEPDPNNLPGKTESIARIDSRDVERGAEIGNLLMNLVPVLVERGLID